MEQRVLTTAEKSALRKLISAHGISVVARACSVATEPLTRALAGLEVRRGTILAIRDGMESIS